MTLIGAGLYGLMLRQRRQWLPPKVPHDSTSVNCEVPLKSVRVSPCVARFCTAGPAIARAPPATIWLSLLVRLPVMLMLPPDSICPGAVVATTVRDCVEVILYQV